jgi:uncharacterized integral membrane protein
VSIDREIKRSVRIGSFRRPVAATIPAYEHGAHPEFPQPHPRADTFTACGTIRATAWHRRQAIIALELHMRLRTLLIVVLLVLIGLFVALNWPAFWMPTSLNILFATIQAPLGIVMLGFLLVIVAAFAIYLVVWQGSMLVETRRQAKELQQQRLLADQAEASRLAELHATLKEEARLLGERITQTHEALRQEIRDNGNSLAAALAEMDDRSRRGPGTA